jgi:predicted DNA-binding ribbon-helix-helix protein
MGILADNELTPKQQLFVDAYLSNGFNGVDAARKAGYKGEYKTLSVVASENLDKPYIVKAIANRTNNVMRKAEKTIVNVYEEFHKNLAFVSKLRDACDKWLKDPETDEFTIAPRDTEIDIVYTDVSGEVPVQRREPLNVILARLHDKGIPYPSPFIKTVDLREYALKACDSIDKTLDKFAKMGGEYTQDKKNPADNKTIIEETIRELMAENIPEEQIREVLAERYPETVH